MEFCKRKRRFSRWGDFIAKVAAGSKTEELFRDKP
jgi:hypothetical protein